MRSPALDATDTVPAFGAVPLRPPPTRGVPAVRISNLDKRFGIRRGWMGTILHPLRREYATVLSNISLEVAVGEFVGVLGPNGAGKTTLFKILSGLILPDRGTVEVCGLDVVRDLRAVRQLLRPAVSEERSLMWRLSARENLRFYAALYDLRGKQRDQRIQEVLAAVDLSDTGDKMVAKFSSGMRQRLLIARALLTDPQVLLLDEPSRSLDPVSAKNLRNFLRTDIVAKRGCTVILATHSPEEALELCDRVAVLDRGRLLREGTPDSLMAAMHGFRFRFHYPEAHRDRFTAWLSDRPRIAEADATSGTAEEGWISTILELPGGTEESAVVIEELVSRGVGVGRVEQVRHSLADLIERIVAEGKSGGDDV
jgi:ABC-2 type transport system ATP-binding protein